MPDRPTDAASTTARAAPDIADAPERQRYEAHLEGDLAGVLEYEVRRDRLILIHTEVAPPYEGRGVAAAITKFALDDASRRGLRVTAVCPYVKGYLARHPEALAAESRRPRPHRAPSRRPTRASISSRSLRSVRRSTCAPCASRSARPGSTSASA